jgi:hypothetical protein
MSSLTPCLASCTRAFFPPVSGRVSFRQLPAWIDIAMAVTAAVVAVATALMMRMVPKALWDAVQRLVSVSLLKFNALCITHTYLALSLTPIAAIPQPVILTSPTLH